MNNRKKQIEQKFSERDMKVINSGILLLQLSETEEAMIYELISYAYTVGGIDESRKIISNLGKYE